MTSQKKKTYLISAVIALVLGILISVAFSQMARNESEKMNAATFVETEEEFAEALKRDGVIYAKGRIEGSYPMDEETFKEELDLKHFPFGTTYVEEAVQAIQKKDYLHLDLWFGKYEGTSDKKERIYHGKRTAVVQVDEVELLGQKFSTKTTKILPFNEETIYKSPARVMDDILKNGEMSSEDKLIVKGSPSPLDGVLEVTVENGKINDEKVIFHTEEYVKSLGNIEETQKTNNPFGFLTFGVIVAVPLFFLIKKLVAKFVH